MKHIFLTYLLFSSTIFYAQNSEAQRTNIWYFGNGAGLDFSSGSPVAITYGALYTYESTGSICDINGNLLFYTDGDTIWNKNHNPMPNGTGLLGCGEYGSSAQSGLIVPNPGNDSLFYIFTNDCHENLMISGLRYSVVNMNLNGGLGDVTTKNILLLPQAQEALAATKHANGTDIWVMAHECNSNNFFCYKVDSTGVITTPVISPIGRTVSQFQILTITFSPDGNKLATAYQNIEQTDQLFDFDNSTGTVFNLINLHAGLSGQSYCPKFSADNSKLYYMVSGSYIYQYCLNVEQDSASISNTYNLVAYHPDNSAFGQLQNAPDGKIYISSQYNDSISTIEYPNNYGTSCNVIARHFYLGGKQSTLGLPIFVESYFYDNTLISQSCDSITGIIANDDFSFLIYPNPASEYITIKPNGSKNGVVQLVNVLGQTLAEKQMNSLETTIELSGFSFGIYFIVVSTQNSIYKQKILISQ